MIRKKITKLIPFKFKKKILHLNIRLFSFLILNSKIIRNFYIKTTIENFQPNKDIALINKSSIWTLGSFWDSDGRFKWMHNICLEEKVNMILSDLDDFYNTGTVSTLLNTISSKDVGLYFSTQGL